MNHLNRLTDLTASFYDLIFKAFWLGCENDYRQRVINLMGLTGDESVLDCGCGTGTLTLMIARGVNGKGNVFGIDLSPRMIEIARRKALKKRRQVQYKVASSLAIPFDNETFDVVVTSLVYHQFFSLEERIETLSQIRRVLKPGGRYIAAEFTKFTTRNLLITYDSLIRKIGLFSSEPLQESGFHIMEKVETARGITIISVSKQMRK